MKSVFRYITLLVSVGAIVSISGCGYNIGYTSMHPDIKSIAIAPVKNNTVVYNAASLVRGMLCEAFNVDGSMKQSDMPDRSSASWPLYVIIEEIFYVITEVFFNFGFFFICFVIIEEIFNTVRIYFS